MNGKVKIYLAGGMKSGWQDRVINKFSDRCIIFNPQDHKLNCAKEYTIWDLHFVSRADVIFGYLEKDNPSGFGLAVEIGYARALNKTIILVDEKSNTDPSFSIYFKIVRETSDIVFGDFESGLNYLERFSIY